MDANAVLDFWFGNPSEPGFGKTRPFWFTKSDSTDEVIRNQFGNVLDSALRNELDAWASSPRGTLALIIVLDQFARNIHRNTARAFAGDSKALRLAADLVDRGEDRALQPVERWFAYMPFEHSEFLNDQHESVRLFERLARDGLPEPLPWAIKHLEVIERFGRFPHRNAIVGRASTTDEAEFLKTEGSRF
jgi:uncharacterized protein (DUF924 family)